MKSTTIHSCCCVLGLLAANFATPFRASAADHAEAPLVESDQAVDIADVYTFLDPNDNSKVILAFDVHAFIVPGENSNLGGFDKDVLFRLNIENTGYAKPDKVILINFDEQTSRSLPQTAHITINGKKKHETIRFTASTTVSSATSPTAATRVVTTDAATGISFFAGLTDDPFFFDIPAFNRFVGSVLGGTPDVSLLNRGRDTFAGYNVQMITLSVPAALLKGAAGNVIGVSATTLRGRHTRRSDESDPFDDDGFVAIDRMGVPAVNTALIPFPRKNEYNRATTQQDAAGKFAGDIVATLTALGTDAAHIGILASVAVSKGDMLRLDTAISNSGSQGGNNSGAGFPNGRRPTADVIDTLLFLITNEGLTTGDNVNDNDLTFRNTFPFFAPSHQPRDSGVIDDNTRN
ncbi:MAG: DUF4331 domain-containing protein [Pedosphaera sp.]|nr:DUF4331 domain-containing protein [Pedosphaera sp.]